MAKTRYINIDFPFKDSDKGFYLNLNQTDRDAIRADLLHLLLTTSVVCFSPNKTIWQYNLALKKLPKRSLK